jgi:hypothetical protein
MRMWSKISVGNDNWKDLRALRGFVRTVISFLLDHNLASAWKYVGLWMFLAGIRDALMEDLKYSEKKRVR